MTAKMATKKAPEPVAAPPARRTAYLVLGMHRSGTSAVTQLLGLAGARLPAHVMPGDEHNAKGYFEPWKIALFNDQRLRAGGGAWDDVFSFPYRSLAAAEEAEWRDEAKALFAEEYGKVRWPLLKDPRVTVLLPFWREVFDALAVDARCVIPVRHPLAVAGSLARRDGFPPEKSVLLWSAYMLAAEAYTRDLPRVFVDYDSLLADWRREVARIEAAHGAALPKLTEKAGKAIDAFLTPELRHNAGLGELSDLGWAGELTREVFDWFQAAAADRTPDTAPLARASEALEARRREIGALVSPAARDLDMTRSELREARSRLEVEIAERRREREELEAELQVFYRAVETAEAALDAAITEP
ncbi:hypothetical protein DJ017_19205 [Phenylobacterium soli]|uniref:Sulfotransferase family protein n=2 Tax=Phenylobacterium soli TaxID=2170551 RepID=A0A328ABH2_9CAUL|nr:hypothetical protein DJ017_19205 [Phenylobacterium soli]